MIHKLASFGSSYCAYSLFAECKKDARIYNAHGSDCEKRPRAVEKTKARGLLDFQLYGGVHSGG